MLTRMRRLRQRLMQRSRERRAALRAARDGDVQAFLHVAQRSFLELQGAWDRADLPAMGRFVTAPLLAE